MKKVLMSIGFLGLLFAGCFHAPGGIAPSTIPVDPHDYTIIEPNATGTDCVWRLLEIIPISAGNHLHTAVKEAIQDAKADALINVTVETTGWDLLIIGRSCTEVRGQGIRIQPVGPTTSSRSTPTETTP
jgi:hypothetical protein